MACENAKKILSFEGLIAPPITAFKADGEVNLDIIPQYIEHLVSQGVLGVYVNGTSGEGLSLSVNERKATAEQWVKHGIGKFDIIVINVSANSIKDVQELARHAEKIGATGILSLPPLFFRISNLDQLVEYFKEIAKAAPSMPLMLYNLPGYTRTEISVADFMPMARRAIPNFVGAKFTSLDVRDLLRCHKEDPPQYKVWSGYDEVILPCLSCGVTGAVGVTYNFMAAVTLKIFKAYKKGNMNEARKLCNELTAFDKQITRHGQEIVCYRAAMNLLGPFDIGPPRTPLFPLDAKSQENLKKDVESFKSVWKI